MSSQDMDAFLTTLETKLKSPYTSLDLTKTIQSSSNPASYLKQLGQALSRLTKPIQLRCLVALLGLDFDLMNEEFQKLERQDNFHDDDEDDEGQSGKGKRMAQLTKAIDALLSKAEEETKEENKWVRIMAGIIRGKLFEATHPTTTDNSNDVDPDDCQMDANTNTTATSTKTENDSSQLSNAKQQHPSSQPAPARQRSKETDEEIRKAVDAILTNVQSAAKDAYACRSEAEVALGHSSDSDSDEDNAKSEINLIDSLQLETDVAPLYAPWSYGLVSPKLLDVAMPEIAELKHCNFNMEAKCLNVDAEMEKREADKEERLLEKKERIAKEKERKMGVNGKSAPGSGGGGASSGVTSARTSASVNNGANSLKSPSKTNGMNKSRIPGKISSSALKPTKGKANGFGRGRAAEAVQKVSRLGGLGRGAAANAVGGRSLANPMMNRNRQQKLGMGKSSFMNSRKKPAGALSSNASNAAKGIGGSTLSKSSAIGKSSSALAAGRNQNKKMKMIDVTEVEGLNKEHEDRKVKLTEQEAQESKMAARKRKIIAKSGLAKRGRLNPGNTRLSETSGQKDKASTDTASNQVNKEMSTEHHDVMPAQSTAQQHAPMNGNNQTAPLQHTTQQQIPQHQSIVTAATYDQRLKAIEQAQYGSVEPTPIVNHAVNNSRTLSVSDKIELMTTMQYQDNTTVMPNSYSTGSTPHLQHLQPEHGQQQQQLQQQQQHQYLQHQTVPSLPKTLPIMEYNHSSLNQQSSQLPHLQQQQQQQIQQTQQYQAQQHQAQQHQTQQLSQQQHHQTSLQQQQYYQQQQQQQQQQQRPSAPQQNWHQLLEKSNKITSTDRERVEHFFTSRYNPTPQIPKYKIKLNEDKTIDPSTGQAIKETLYLELDYGTFGYKMLRKVKKK